MDNSSSNIHILMIVVVMTSLHFPNNFRFLVFLDCFDALSFLYVFSFNSNSFSLFDQLCSLILRIRFNASILGSCWAITFAFQILNIYRFNKVFMLMIMSMSMIMAMTMTSMESLGHHKIGNQGKTGSIKHELTINFNGIEVHDS